MAKENGLDKSDDTTPPSGTPIGHQNNRELLTVLGNIRLEAKEHSRKLDTLYEAIISIQWPAPPRWISDLHDELDRHHKEYGESIANLKPLTT